MHILKLTAFLVLVFASAALAAPVPPLLLENERSPAAQVPEDARLIKTVMLMRHGVRSPLESSETLASWSEKEWPTWPVPAGYLTDRGVTLMQASGEKLRDRLNFQNLFTEGVCPPAASVQVYADNEQRTMASAAALLEGFAPGCQLTFTSLGSPAESTLPQGKGPLLPHEIDPLFHPTEAGLIPTEAQRAAIAKEAAQLMPMLSQDLAPQISLIQSLIGPHPALCASFQLPTDCTLNDIPSRVHQEFRSPTDTSPGYYKATIMGGLPIGRSIAELWLMESAQWPEKPLAWGLLPPSAVSTILPAHSRTFYALNAMPTLVQFQGGPLLKRILATLSESAPVPADNTAPLVIFIGHDTNIASVSALLKLSWRQQAYPYNAIPPGSALVFTLWDWQNTKLVGMYFTSQPLSVLQSNDKNVLRTSEKLITALRLSGTAPILNHDTLYPLTTLAERVNAVLK